MFVVRRRRGVPIELVFGVHVLLVHVPGTPVLVQLLTLELWNTPAHCTACACTVQLIYRISWGFGLTKCTVHLPVSGQSGYCTGSTRKNVQIERAMNRTSFERRNFILVVMPFRQKNTKRVHLYVI